MSFLRISGVGAWIRETRLEIKSGREATLAFPTLGIKVIKVVSHHVFFLLGKSEMEK